MVSARLFSVWLWVRFPLKTLVTLAQLVERKTFNLVVMGSSPILDTLSVWRNWIARQTSNLKVAGSIPVMDTR